MDKKQKQELQEVLKKYNRTKSDIAGGYVRSLGKGAIFGVALDVIFTGGFGTLAAITAASFPTLKAMGRASLGSGILQPDKRVQQIKAGADAQVILFTTQMNLSTAFEKAVSRSARNPIDPSHALENKFLEYAKEVEEDIRKLRPAFKIVSGGTGGYGTDEFKIMVHRLKPNIDYMKQTILTLDEARTQVRQKIDDEDRQLAEQLAKKLAPKPANDVKPAPPKKRPGFNI